MLLKNLPGKNSELKYCEEYFNLISSIIRACGENFILEEVSKEANVEMTDSSTAADSMLMKDKENWQSPKANSMQAHGNNKRV